MSGHRTVIQVSWRAALYSIVAVEIVVNGHNGAPGRGVPGAIHVSVKNVIGALVMLLQFIKGIS